MTIVEMRASFLSHKLYKELKTYGIDLIVIINSHDIRLKLICPLIDWSGDFLNWNMIINNTTDRELCEFMNDAYEKFKTYLPDRRMR